MRIRGFLTLATALAITAGNALAQPSRDNPYMRYMDRQEWQSQIRVRIDGQAGRGQGTTGVKRAELNFESAIVILPALKRTATSLAHRDGVHIQAQLRGRTGPVEFELIGDIEETADLLPAGTRLARVDVPGVSGPTQIEFIIDAAHSCFATSFNDKLARELDWPETWPPEALATFEDEIFVTVAPDGTDQRADVRTLIDSFINDKDPKTLPPLDLAKFLTTELTTYFQVQGRNTLRISDRTVQPAGAFNPSIITAFPVRSSGDTARAGRGTPADLVTLWVAMMREVGLPARIVIGYDLGEDIGNRRAQPGFPEEEPGIRLWGEFALYDAERDILTWVPVDVPRLDEFSNLKRDWRTPWNYFGTHEQLSTVIPLAHQWTPPVPSESYGPALWGWTVTPVPPDNVEQFVTFSATSVDRRIGSARPPLENAAGLATSIAGPVDQR